LQAPYVGAKDKDKEQDKDKDFGKSENLLEEKPIVPAMVEEFKKVFPKYHNEQQKDFIAVFEIAKKIGEEKKYTSTQILSEGREYVLRRWGEIIVFIKNHKWYSTRSLEYMNKDWQQLIQTINSNGTNRKTHSNGTVFDRP
jgi:hypothetical protein